MKTQIRFNLIEAIETDDSYQHSKEQKIVDMYDSMNIPDRDRIDDIFIILCGYTLKHLIEENFNE